MVTKVKPPKADAFVLGKPKILPRKLARVIGGGLRYLVTRKSDGQKMRTLRHSEDADEILGRLHALRPSSERQWGRMSVQQMVCHLSDGFLLYMGEKSARPAPTPGPRKLLKWFALWIPIPWPHGFKTFPELDQEVGGTRPAEFEKDVDRLQALIKRFTSGRKDFKWPETHPHFGPMTEADWQRLGYLHTNHHLRQFGC